VLTVLGVSAALLMRVITEEDGIVFNEAMTSRLPYDLQHCSDSAQVAAFLAKLRGAESAS